MNHVFVDFENVPSVDLSLIGDHPVEVTLLLGEKQRRLDLKLVQQIHKHATKVTLIEVGSSGHNALDLVLAWHLGKVAERHPDDPFFVVSKDKDFDPLLRHLRAIGLNAARVDAFAALPFIAPPTAARKISTPRAIAPAENEKTRATTEASPSDDDDRLAKLIDRLQHKTKARPVRRKTLLSHINGFYGNQLTEPELATIAETLQQRGVITIDPQGRIDYPVGAAAGEKSAGSPRRTRRQTGG
jgi:hypothetical protein